MLKPNMQKTNQSMRQKKWERLAKARAWAKAFANKHKCEPYEVYEQWLRK